MTDFTKASSLVLGQQLKDYFLQHVTPFKRGDQIVANFWVVTKELKVFKRTAYPTSITALIIPVGAKIYAMAQPWQLLDEYDDAFGGHQDYRKMRASSAFVHGCYERIGKHRGRPISFVRSIHQFMFTYNPGAVVRPNKKFSLAKAACAPGIHFFLNFYDAYTYR